MAMFTDCQSESDYLCTWSKLLSVQTVYRNCLGLICMSRGASALVSTAMTLR